MNKIRVINEIKRINNEYLGLDSRVLRLGWAPLLLMMLQLKALGRRTCPC